MEELYDLKNKINNMKDHYKRRIETADSLIDDLGSEPFDSTTQNVIARLRTKRAGYRSFLSELNKLI